MAQLPSAPPPRRCPGQVRPTGSPVVATAGSAVEAAAVRPWVRPYANSRIGSNGPLRIDALSSKPSQPSIIDA